MSTAYGYQCRECQTYSALFAKWPDWLRDWVAIAPLVKRIDELPDASGLVEVRIMGLSVSPTERPPFDWLADHIGHELVLYDEYGRNHQLTVTAADLLGDPSASRWLKDTIKGALERDPVDAANEAEILARVLRRRADQALAS